MRRGLSPFLSPPSAVSQQPSVGQQQGSWARAASARAGCTGRRVPVSFNVALSSSVTPSVRATPRTPTDDWAGLRCYLGPFAGDEHHQVRPPRGLPFLLSEAVHPNPNFLLVGTPPLGLPLLLCEAVRPNPNILFVFRSESNYKCICMCYAC